MPLPGGTQGEENARQAQLQEEEILLSKKVSENTMTTDIAKVKVIPHLLRLFFEAKCMLNENLPY